MVLTAVVAVGAGLAVASTYQGMEARKDAKSAARKSAEEQRKIQAEQKAQNASQAAAERRKQVREERIKRARILQASENTGVSASSGELGAVGGLSTQLNSNVGANLGALQTANNISIFSQNAANFDLQRQFAQMDAQSADQMASLGMSLFSAGGGFDTVQSWMK